MGGRSVKSTSRRRFLVNLWACGEGGLQCVNLWDQRRTYSGLVPVRLSQKALSCSAGPLKTTERLIVQQGARLCMSSAVLAPAPQSAASIPPHGLIWLLRGALHRRGTAVWGRLAVLNPPARLPALVQPETSTQTFRLSRGPPHSPNNRPLVCPSCTVARQHPPTEVQHASLSFDDHNIAPSGRIESQRRSAVAQLFARPIWLYWLQAQCLCPRLRESSPSSSLRSPMALDSASILDFLRWN